eukprot:TRINITY_DN3623_c0_g1_i1.p1 TRINITY_DN3623_c0_g1~~TRINITY_DN3623_c0_g1_i1.p1  ORF type:complete len:698 (-),score=156.98 TRINITY_DN3623_c0_g1_i1:155-1945(-)
MDMMYYVKEVPDGESKEFTISLDFGKRISATLIAKISRKHAKSKESTKERPPNAVESKSKKRKSNRKTFDGAIIHKPQSAEVSNDSSSSKLSIHPPRPKRPSTKTPLRSRNDEVKSLPKVRSQADEITILTEESFDLSRTSTPNLPTPNDLLSANSKKLILSDESYLNTKSHRLVQKREESPFGSSKPRGSDYEESSPLTLIHFNSKKSYRHSRPNSDNIGGTEGIAKLKREYKNKQDMEVEKYLIDEIIKKNSSGDVHVAYVIWKCLMQWEAFGPSSTIHLTILGACEEAIDSGKQFKKITVGWLAVSLSLLYFIDVEMKNTGPKDDPATVKDVLSKIQNLTIISFESVINLLKEQLGPLLKITLNDTISSLNTTLDSVDQSSLDEFFFQLTEWTQVLLTTPIFEPIKKQFISRISHYLVSSVMELLFTKECSYGTGFQVKMFQSKAEVWVRSALGKECSFNALDELLPIRQAASIFMFGQKEDLAKKECREDICPLLRPAHVALLLDGYRPDEFYKEPVPQTLITKISQQDASYKSESLSFDPHYAPKLRFDFTLMPIDINSINIPRVILDKPGLSFLRAVNFQFESSNSFTWG